MSKTVYITGIAGTLGKAFARFLVSEGYAVSGIDASEWAVSELQKELPNARIELGDITEVDGSWDYLIHCAAYKHVNILQQDPIAAVQNNLIRMMDMFKYIKVIEHTLFISTDKAVEPISTYGYTKAIGEQIVWYRGGSVARLGNIKSSTGSVIPLWEQAVREGKPLPITDPNMTRYMISADEAVKQIWPRFLKGEKLIIPEMGEAKRLGDIVEELFPGYTTEIIGMRPGEKMHEKLRWDHE